MCSAVSRLLLLCTARFTADATLSEETEDAGDIKYFRAMSESTGVKWRQLDQNFVGFSFLGIIGWSKYCFSSLGIPSLVESKLEFAEAAAISIIIFSCPDHNDSEEFSNFKTANRVDQKQKIHKI